MEEWREITAKCNGTSKLRRLYIDGVPTNKYMYDGRAMPIVSGGAPDIIDKQVGASSDDAGEKTNGVVSITEDKIDYGSFSASKYAGVRFLDVMISDGATIDTAYLTWKAYTSDSGTFTSDFYAEDDSNPGTFVASNYNISNRVPTTASVAWDNPESWTVNLEYNSPELKTIVQELVDSYSYSGGLPIVLINKLDSGAGERRAYSWDYQPASAAQLHIEYTMGGPTYYHGLKVHGVGELALCDVGSHPLRIRKGGTTYGIELVDTADPNASAIRIKTPGGVKAIRKYT